VLRKRISILRTFGFTASAILTIARCSAEPIQSKFSSEGRDATRDSTTNSAHADTANSSALKPINQASLQAVISAAAKDLLVPGAVVLLRTPQGQFTVNYGTTQLGIANTPNAQTHFRIASNTKTMTAALILLLAQENKLALDDPISKYVSGVPNGDKITIANLLQMRSGLYNYSEAPEISNSIDHVPTKVWTPEELLAIAFKHPCTALPGTTFEYNNSNYALLGLVTEKVGGKPLAQAMHDRLFGPFHMIDTLLPVAASNVIPKPYSHGYLYGSSSVALVGTPPYSREFQAEAKAGKFRPKDYTNVNHSFAAAAGGVVSNASDLATWIHSLTSGAVFKPEYQRRWLDSVQLEDPKNPAGLEYGYGIVRLHWGPNSFYYHGGETPGYNSFIGYDPTNKVTLIVWTNLTVSLDQLPTANTLMLKVLDHIYVVSPIPPSPPRTPSRDDDNEHPSKRKASE
jgi:D-alanyl-D-alanine carboxypeptidase